MRNSDFSPARRSPLRPASPRSRGLRPLEAASPQRHSPERRRTPSPQGPRQRPRSRPADALAANAHAEAMGISIDRYTAPVSILGHPNEVFNSVYAYHSEHNGSPILPVLKNKAGMYCYRFTPKDRWLLNDQFTPDSDVCHAYIQHVLALPIGAQTWQCLDWTRDRFVDCTLTVMPEAVMPEAAVPPLALEAQFALELAADRRMLQECLPFNPRVAAAAAAAA